MPSDAIVLRPRLHGRHHFHSTHLDEDITKRDTTLTILHRLIGYQLMYLAHLPIVLQSIGPQLMDYDVDLSFVARLADDMLLDWLMDPHPISWIQPFLMLSCNDQLQEQ
jgi:hypothetical protein